MDTDPPGPPARPSGPSGASSYGSSSPSDATWQRPSQATNQYPPQTAPPLDPQARNQIYSDRLNEYRARRFHEHSRHRPPRSSHRPRSLLHALATAPSHSAPQVFLTPEGTIHNPIRRINVTEKLIKLRNQSGPTNHWSFIYLGLSLFSVSLVILCIAAKFFRQIKSCFRLPNLPNINFYATSNSLPPPNSESSHVHFD